MKGNMLVKSVFLLILAGSLTGCSLVQNNDKSKLVGEWKNSLQMLTSGDYYVYNDNIQNIYTNGALEYSFTNAGYGSYVLSNNNTCLNKYTYTNGSIEFYGGTWSLSSTSKKFTMTWHNITNVTSSTDIMQTYSMEMFYSLENNNHTLRIHDENLSVTYTMYGSVPTNFSINMSGMFGTYGVSYIDMVKN